MKFPLLSLLALTICCIGCKKEYPGYSGKIDHFDHYYFKQFNNSNTISFVNTDNSDTLVFNTRIEQNLSNPTCTELANDGNCYYQGFSSVNLSGPKIKARVFDNGNGYTIDSEYNLIFSIFLFESNASSYFPDKGYINLYAAMSYPMSTVLKYPSLDTINVNNPYTVEKSESFDDRITVSTTTDIVHPHIQKLVFDKELGILSFEMSYKEMHNNVETRVIKRYKNMLLTE